MFESNLFGAEELSQSFLFTWIAVPESKNERQGSFPLLNVISHGFAQFIHVAGVIEGVVNELEGDSKIMSIGASEPSPVPPPHPQKLPLSGMRR